MFAFIIQPQEAWQVRKIDLLRKTSMNYREMIEYVKQVALEAGEKILEVYNSPDFEVELKSDHSPVTKADKVANDYIVEQLQQKYPDFGVLAEESKADASRLEKLFVWIIDPLDGTKEFIKRNGEFTVNIGLVENGEPRLGVVYVPAKADLYYAATGVGAFFQHGEQAPVKIQCSGLTDIQQMTLMKSRSHASPVLLDLIEKYQFAATKDSGSSIKICLIAQGEAEVYYRFGPTNEWDISAAHCVLNEAGGKMTDCFGNAIRYNREDPLNRNGFTASNNTIHEKLVEISKEYFKNDA